MSSALLVEGIHAALGASRREIGSLIEEIEKSLERVGRSIEQRVGAALASSDSSKEGADAIMALSADRSHKKELQFIGSFIATLWGGQVALAGINATGTIVAIGVGVEVAPIVAIIFGLLVLFYSGRYCFGVIKELLGRLETASSEAF